MLSCFFPLKALLDLEMNSDMKSQLRDLHVTAAKETDVGGGKKSVIVFVPVPQVALVDQISYLFPE